MAYNRIAIYGHRGWASSAIVSAIIASGAPVKVLFRPGSDASGLPPSVSKVEVDVANTTDLVTALQDVDILISLVGHEGVPQQHHLIAALPRTKVQLFVPSDLAARYDEQGLRIHVNKEKYEVEQAARKEGIALTIVLPGNIAEFALATPAMGVDCRGNRIIFSGDSAKQKLNLCTRQYVAEGYASIFASTPIEQIKGRTLGLSELQVTGEEIANALEKKHGTAPQKVHHSIERIDKDIETELANDSVFALAHYCRKIWGTGAQIKMIGDDIWEVKDYPKATIDELIVEGALKPYREMPPEAIPMMMQVLNQMFQA